MKKDQVDIRKKQGIAGRTNEVEEVRRQYMAPEYELRLYPGCEIGKTGRLDIGELRPCRPVGSFLPRFGIRWDEGKSEIDADAFDCTDEERGRFRKGEPGYSGHHSTILGGAGRVADWVLCWNGRLLYHGWIRCSVGRDFEASVAVGIGVTASAVHERVCRNCGERFTVVNNEHLCPRCWGGHGGN